MSKQYRYARFENVAGGLNESISDMQVYNSDAITAKNVIFDRYGSYGKLRKRSGRARVNSTALPGTIKGIIPFTLNDTAYLQYYVEGSSQSYMYNAGLDASGNPTAAVTAILTCLKSTVDTYFDTLDDKLFGNFKSDITLKDSCSATISATTSGAIAGPWRAFHAITLSAQLDIENSTNFYTEGDSCYKMMTTSATYDSYEGFEAVYSAAGYSISGKLLTVDLMVEASLRDQTEADTYSDDYNPSIVRISIYNMEDDGSFVNGAAYDFKAPSDSPQIFSQSFATYTIDPSSITEENGWTYSAFGSGFTVSSALGKLTISFKLGGVTGDDEAGGEDVSMWIDNLRLKGKQSGLMSYTASDGWVKVIDEAAPVEPTAVIEFDGRLWVAEENDLSYSYPLDGTNFTDGGKFSIGKGDGDSIQCLRKLGQQLLAFKKNSITRITPSNGTVLPYIAKTVYSGDVSQKGIGCVAGKTAKNVILGTANDDYLGALEYVIFLSHNGLYAIGTSGAPILISKRIDSTLNTSTVIKSAMFAAMSPEESLYLLALTDGAGESDSQLVYSSTSKAYSVFDLKDITTLSEIFAVNKAYMLMGDKNGYIYKYAHFTSDALTNYKDQNSDGSYSAIAATYQSKYSNYENDGSSIQAQDFEIGVGHNTTDCPITYTLVNENGNSTTGSIATASSISGEVYVTGITAKLYGKYISYKFENSTSENSMVIYFWKPGIFLFGA